MTSTTLAQLGIEIKTSGVVESKNHLDNLTVSAKKCQEATRELNRTSEDSVKANKNAALSMELMISKLTESGAVYNARKMQVQGYANDEIALINSLIKKNNNHAEALKINAQIEKQILDQKTANYKKYINDVADGNAHLLRMEKERLSNEEFAIKASYNSRKLMYENLFKEQQSIAQRMSTGSAPTSYNSQIRGDISAGMSAAGTDALRAQEKAARDLYDANNKLADSSKNAAHGHGLHSMSIIELTAQMAKMMVIYRGINFMAATPVDVIKTNMEFEKLKVQLEGITGSVSGAQVQFEKMSQLDFKTPFDMQGITKTWVMLKNYGLEPTDMVMKSLTDSVAKLGGGTNDLIGIGRQLGQAWAKDKLQLVDMRPMIERGLPVITLLGKALNKNAGEILEMSKAGTIGRQEMLKLFDAMEKWSPNASLRSMNTMYGALSNVTSSWQKMQDAMLNSNGERGLQSFFESISDSMSFMTKHMNTVISSLGTILTTTLSFGTAFLLATSNVTVFSSALNVAKTAMLALSTANPFTLFITAIGTAIGLLVSAKHHMDDLSKMTLQDKVITIKEQIKYQESRVKNAEGFASAFISQDQLEKEKALLEYWKGALANYEGQLNQTKLSVEAATDDFKLLAQAQEQGVELNDLQSDSLKKARKSYEEGTAALDEWYSAHEKDVGSLETYTSLFDGYILALQKANKAEEERNKTDAQKALEKQIQKNKELTDSIEENNHAKAMAVDGSDAQKKAYEDELNKETALIEARNARTKAIQEAESARKKEIADQERAIEVSDKIIFDLMNDAELRKVSSSELAKESEIRRSLSLVLDNQKETVRNLINVKYEEMEARKLLDNQTSATNSVIDEEVNKYNELTMSVHDAYIEKLRLRGVPEDRIPATTTLHEENTKLENEQKSIDEARSKVEKYNQELFNAQDRYGQLSDVSASFFDSSSSGIDKLTGAFTNMLKALDNNHKAEKALHEAKIANAILEKNTNNKTQEEIKKNNGQYLVDLKTIHNFKATVGMKERVLELDTLKDSLSGIRQTSSALGQMFAENSAARKAFNIISLAASVSERLADIAQLEVKAAIAVIEQGKGDPYTAFARMAAMAAIVASILASANAGTFNFSGSSKSPGPQGLSPTTGTVLGDTTAQSESVDKTYQLLKDIHAEEYATLRSIDRGISNLHSGITDVITRLFQAGGLSTITPSASTMTGIANYNLANPLANAFGFNMDPIGNFILGGLFGGKKTSTVTAQGISTNATSLFDIMNGGDLSAQQFAQIETKTSGGWFGKDKFSFSTQYSALDDATQKALNDVFKSMGKTMFGLADALGGGLSDRVKNYVIPALTVDLKGLNGEDAAKKLNGVISTALDTMSVAVFGDIIGQYQQLGEGMLETAVRIVAEVAVVKDALGKSGLSVTGDAIAISDALVQAAGGLQEFQKSFDNYYQKFYTDSERNVFLQKNLSSQLSDVNLILPKTRDGYRSLIESLDINNTADQERYSLLIKLSGAADNYYSVLEDVQQKALDDAKSNTDKLANIEKQKRGYEIQLMQLSGDAIGALTAQRKLEYDALDEALKDSQLFVWALTDANKAVDDAMKVLKKSVDDQKKLNEETLKSAETSAKDANKALDDAMNVLKKSVADQKAVNEINKQSASDYLSSITDIAEKLKSALSATVVESDSLTKSKRESAQATLNSALSYAQSGGSLNDFSGLEQALADVSSPSQNLYSTFVEYARDQGRTSGVISQLSAYADLQRTVAEQTLDAINAENTRLDELITTAQSQIDAANGTTVAVMSVEDAVTNLATALDNKIYFDDQYKLAKETYDTETTALNDILTTAQAQIDAINGTTVATMTVEDAVNNLAVAIDSKAATESAIATAQTAADTEASYKAIYDAAAATSATAASDTATAQSAYDNALSSYESALSASQSASEGITTAESQAATILATSAPTTYISGQTNDAIWEKVLGDYNQASIERFGTPMNRSWTADSDASTQYAKLVEIYNSLKTSYAQSLIDSATSTAAAAESSVAAAASTLSSAEATLATYQGYQADADAATSTAYSEYATAAAYSDAATAAIPNVQSFAVGTNYVPDNMLANIHEGERIIPAADNTRLFNKLNENDGSAEEIRQLREENKAQAKAIVILQNELLALFKRWDTDGLPETRDITA